MNLQSELKRFRELNAQRLAHAAATDDFDGVTSSDAVWHYYNQAPELFAAFERAMEVNSLLIEALTQCRHYQFSDKRDKIIDSALAQANGCEDA